MPVLPGRRLGPYEILTAIGAGGMGEVYRARDTRLDRIVAIKVLPTHLADRSELRERFEREARTIASLNHPHICTLFDIGQQDGIDYLVMEYLEGETLAQRLLKGSLPLEQVLQYAIEIADALDKAHRKGVTHRDLKPGNIMLTKTGTKLLDFGLAKVDPVRGIGEGVGVSAMPTATAEGLLTIPGTTMGTMAYMSPEQARGEELDARTDLFSFGAVLYEMATSQLAFPGNTPAIIYDATLNRAPIPAARLNPELPPNLEELINKALEKDRKLRYQSAADIRTDLQRVKRDSDSGRHVAAAGDERSTSATSGSSAASARADRVASVPATGLAKRHTVVWPFISAIVALCGLLFGFDIAGLRERITGRLSAKRIESIAVLPFVNTTKDPNMEYLSDGITESLIADLSQIPKLRVLAPATIFKYKGRQIDPRTVGQELHVSAVLQGSVTKFGDALRIAVDLVNSADETELWGEHYNSKLADILPVEEDISREIVGKLRLRLNREETERLAKFSTEDPEAYQLYLKGRYYWNKRSEERVREAIRYFEEAIAKDPTYARAYAGLADSYIILGSYEFVAPNDAYPKAKAAAQRALELDDTVAEAHTSLAWVRSVYDWDSHEAEKQFKRALELNPNYATAHHWYGLFLTNGARFEEAMREMNRAQDLDPLSLIITTQAGEPFYLSRRFGRAIEQYRKALEMDANFWPAHQFLGLAYEGTGQLSSAISELQNALELSGGNTQLMAAIGHTFAVSGNTTEANRILNQLRELSTRRFVSTYGVALIYVGLKENDQAFQWLERSREEKSLLDDHDITTDSRLDELRRDPRFAQLLRSVGLAE